MSRFCDFLFCDCYCHLKYFSQRLKPLESFITKIASVARFVGNCSVENDFSCIMASLLMMSVGPEKMVEKG